MTILRFIFLWLGIVTAFALIGWFLDEFSGCETAVLFAAVGMGVASFIVVGLILFRNIRSNRLAKDFATTLLFVFGIISIVIPGFIVFLVRRATQYSSGDYEKGIHLFQGEQAMSEIVAPGITFLIVACIFIVFLICIFKVKRTG